MCTPGCPSDDGKTFFDGETCIDMGIYFQHKNREPGRASLCGPPESVQETVPGVTLQECARQCETNMFCDGMNYIWEGRVCQLLATTAATSSDGAHPNLPPVSRQCTIPGTFEHFVKVNECGSEPCQNGGFCTPGTRSYSCQCMPGWSGENCEVDVNECEIDNGGCHPERECINIDGSSTCADTCTAGFVPVGNTDCRDVDECTTPSFRVSYPDFVDINGNTCESFSEVFQEGSVLCSMGGQLPMQGDPSRTALTDCAVCGGGHRPCSGQGDNVHDSTCVNSVGSYTCGSCGAGFTGDGDHGCHDM
eukprot:COSAG02_NODE_610_length_19566_cov_39.049622_13_plen_306_part_00